MSGASVYEIITDTIIRRLENGTAPWRKPWRAATGWPRSITGRRYQGINVFLLLAQDFASPYWITRKEIGRRGGHIRKGEHHTKIVFFRKITREDDNGEKKTIPIARYFRVWNLDQVDGIADPDPAPRRPEVLDTPAQRHSAAEALIAGYTNPPTIDETGHAAYYTPSSDSITVPPRTAFDDLDEFYTTVFHELGHSTAHPDRLDRPLGYPFGTHRYGREELIAEMTAAFLAAESGIESTTDNSAAYLRAWIQTIREDSRAVIVAANAAHRAADHILGRPHATDAEHQHAA